ncbi:ribosome biogenesis GTPase Der [Helcococcus kunzii]|uniref:GTPase Der n=1 Tax=Helcococcus kunzii ATCC 51366 TaxID=883114 RepID=H3NN84_9FIRM|nr:ribosome biogenesis GTPase Der [Helcococcus kunzii]EHR34488.1 ribosome-associated GTPase EngA [Helcococcus kunzii ATCC 51366]MCT1795487.1 ribosome biogenesis GTPase Der [Helcococcus kunzii]MCT1989167.1 ribosome biogenesis GTPase Der [Helcococcus kunzii]QUY64733.1 ribosome biogenesis GTPase Der [Helcococcus kunzii]QZO77142.1 ribosome biogenesis GTPase Der [Helcococcus kunzii]
MARPIVSIIGRPNVGKSTLFNKLVGKRLSITEDTPGVTRDRLYSEVEWQNNHFVLVDTGGLELEYTGDFNREIEIQADIAIESSDLILFLVDGREGLTSLDELIAEKLRRSGRKVVVVVNKIESKDTPLEIYEFYNLGIEDLHVISAEQGYGLGDLLDVIVKMFPDDSLKEVEDDRLHIAVIGKPNVGKSSFVNMLVGEERAIVSDIAGTTRDSIDTEFEHNGKKYTFIDTAGLRRQRSIDSRVEKYSTIRTYNAIDRSDIVLFFIDANEGVTEQDTKIIGYAHNENKASIIVVNKWDLIEKDTNTMKDFEAEIRNKITFTLYAPIAFISVINKQRIDKLFDLIEEVDKNYSFRIPTGTLNTLLRDLILLNPPKSKKGKTLKIYYMTQVTTRPPKFLIYVNDEELMHFSYLRYIENKLRENFNFRGVPITLEVRNRRFEV